MNATTSCSGARRAACSLLLLVAVLVVNACGSSDTPAANEPPPAARQIELDPANADTPLVVLGGQTFTEQLILQEIYAQAWQAAGYRVDQRPTDGGAVDQYGRLTGGEVGASPEYLGTFLLMVEGSDIAAVPKEEGAAFAEVEAAVAPTGSGRCRRRRSATPTGSRCAVGGRVHALPAAPVRPEG